MLLENGESSSGWNDDVEEWRKSISHLPEIPRTFSAEQHSYEEKVMSPLDAKRILSEPRTPAEELQSVNGRLWRREKSLPRRNQEKPNCHIAVTTRDCRANSVPILQSQTSIKYQDESKEKMRLLISNYDLTLKRLVEKEKQPDTEKICAQLLAKPKKKDKEMNTVMCPRAKGHFETKNVGGKKETLPLVANTSWRRSWALFSDGNDLNTKLSGWRNRKQRRRYKAKYECSRPQVKIPLSKLPGFISAARDKKTRDFEFVRLEQVVVQQLRDSSQFWSPYKESGIFAMKFSSDGKLLATGGTDAVLRIWTVVGTKLDRARWCGTRYVRTPDGGVHKSPHCCTRKGEVEPPRGSIINPIPYREFYGHKAHILDLDWSYKDNYILTASWDHTVMLWCPQVDACLSIFQHSDIVRSIRFHPMNFNFFLSGSDSKIRLWNIRAHRVVTWKPLDTIVTAVAFSPNGGFIAAGLWSGLCSFFTVDIKSTKLQYHAKVYCKSGRKSGKKVTSIEYLQINRQGEVDHPDHPQGSNWCLVTTSDSRIRLYSLEHYQINLRYKYKGLKNRAWIGSSFSQDGNFVLCGSDDGAVYLWDRDIKPSTAYFSLRKKRSHRKTKSHQRVKLKESCGKLRIAICAPPQTLKYVMKSQVTDLCKRPAIKHVLFTADEHGVIRVFVNYTENPGKTPLNKRIVD